MKMTSRGNSGSKWRILYVEMAAVAGGSVTGLYRLLQGLDRDRIDPVVMLHRSQPLRYMFRDLGVEIVDLPGSVANEGPSPSPSPTPAGEGRSLLARPGLSPTTLPLAGMREVGSPLPSGRERVRVRVPCSSDTDIAKSGLYWSARFYLWFVRRCLPIAWAIRNVILQERIDAVHLNDDIAFNRVALLGAILANVPCLAHVRFFCETRAIDRPLSRFISHYIYMSRALESYTLARFPAAQGTIVYDGLTEDYFQPAADEALVRREFGLEPEDFVVGSLGRLIEWKGHKVLLRALGEIAGKVPNLKCLVVGEPDPSSDTGYLEELKAMTAGLSLADVVKFVGFRPDVRRTISAMDVLVHSSSEPEPFGLVIIEGMAAGKPVIATAAGGVLDIIDDGATGLLVPIGDSAAMAKALLKLIDIGVAGRQQLGTAAFQSARARFAVGSYARGVARVYEQVLTQPIVLQGQRI